MIREDIIAHDHLVQSLARIIYSEHCTAIHIMLIVIEVVGLPFQLLHCICWQIFFGICKEVVTFADSQMGGLHQLIGNELILREKALV